MNVGPVPGGPAADRPAGFWEQIPLSPNVHGGALHAEPFGYLLDADWLTTRHEETVAKVLTVDQDCSDNQYMTETRYTAEAKVSGRSTKIENCRSEQDARNAMATFTAAGYTVTDLTVTSRQVTKTYRLR